MLEGIFDNDMIKNLAFGKLKDHLKKSGCTGYLVSLDVNDDILITEVGKDVVLITTADLKTYQAAILNELKNGS